MPTPPRPGEEPTDETTLYAYHLRRLITWYVEALDAAPPEAFFWQPPGAESNSLASITRHAITSAEWWVLSCVGSGPLERDRDAEFGQADPWPTQRARLLAFLTAAEDLLRSLDATRLHALSRHPAGDRMNRRCLAHTVEHLGLHLGHIEVTLDWWRAVHTPPARE